MAYTPGLGARVQVVVPPQLTATVTITRASGASLIVHSDAARSSAGVTMPATVTGTTFYYLRTDDLYTFSATVNGVECAVHGSTVGSFTTYLSGDTTLSVVVDRETAESSGGGGAGLASPTFTGDPKAPTPAPGDNDTSVATTAFVHGEIATQHTADDSAYVAKTSVGAASGVAPLDSSSLVPVANLPISSTSVVLMGSGAPSNGLGLNGDFYINDANGDIYGPKAIGAWGSVIGNFALLASPAFTGNPTAPTQSAGNNSTRLATTAYADSATTAGALAAPVAFTASGTWTPSTTGRHLFRALVVGGGGAGAPGSSSNGGGGGGGGEVLDDFYLGSVTGDQAITIGAGGATGGASGGNTSIAALAVASGGVGSAGQAGGNSGDGALGAQNINNNPVASGGGGWGSTTSVAGTKGGPGTTRIAAGGGGGGGPTSASGGNGGASTGGAGGTGAALGGGGGGAGNGGAGTNGTSGVGGTGANAPANTGGGGGGGGAGTTPGGAGHGGSGYVIIYQVA